VLPRKYPISIDAMVFQGDVRQCT